MDGHSLSASGRYRTTMYAVFLHGSDTKIGECDIRISKLENRELYYAGDIGYRIYDGWRGHGYAYDACIIMLKIMKEEYDRTSVLLTCSPDNAASRKTIEKAGGTYIETVDVPAWHWLYKRGEKIKEIYRINL